MPELDPTALEAAAKACEALEAAAENVPDGASSYVSWPRYVETAVAAYGAALGPEVNATPLVEALREIAGDYGCATRVPADISQPPREVESCRDRSPSDQHEWCDACIASQALAAWAPLKVRSAARSSAGEPEPAEAPVYELERDRFGLMWSGPVLEVGELVRVRLVAERES
jgi:hypothetical protein